MLWYLFSQNKKLMKAWIQELGDSLIWVTMHTLFAWILKLKNVISFLCIFPMETNQMFVVYNDFVTATHDLHYLKCDFRI